VRNEPVPPGRSYPGFEPHVAWQIERMDGCFGSFIDFLHHSGLYDNSVIVLTSDHGDSLGEQLRWGHSYTMFPQIVRVPLIVHIPPRLRQEFYADPGTISFSIDITPSLYALLGHTPDYLGPLFGVPLFGSGSTDRSVQRHEPYLAVSSYGAVYALLRDNGSRLYIADAVNKRDYAYDLSGTLAVRVGIPPEERAANQQVIRQRVADLARIYRFTPP
jgi:arylsulfatase A-like enzyme